MSELKYTVIKTKEQYEKYSDMLRSFITSEERTDEVLEEIELLEVLIAKWDNEHDTLENHFPEDPIALIRALMAERNMKSKDLVAILGVSKGLVSDILHYKKGLSKQNIRVLADYFKIGTGLLYNKNV